MDSVLFWDQFLFCILATVFLVLNVLNLRNKNEISPETQLTNSPKKRQLFKFKPNPLLKAILNSYTLFLSPILFIGLASETYLVGSQLLINLISIGIGYIIAFVLLIPIIYNLDKTIQTPYEYFEKRFESKVPRIISALSASFFYFSLSTLFLFGAAIVLSTLMPQIPIWISSLIVGIYSMLAIVSKENCFKYSFMTSLVQLGVFLASVLTAIIITLFFDEENSLVDLMDTASTNNRFKFFITHFALTTRYTLWNQLFSLPLPWAVMHCFTAANFAKYRSIKSKNQSRVALISNLPFMFCINFVFFFSGICAFLFYFDCDPVYSGQVANKNQIATKWFIDSISSYIPSLSGIALSCLFSFSIYQQSTLLSTCSKTVINDVINKVYFIENYHEILKKTLIIILTALSIAYSTIFSEAKNSILSLFFFFNNTFNTPILGLFFLSIFNRRANSFGASLSFILCLAFEIWRSINIFFFSNLKSPEIETNLSGCNLTTNSSSTQFNTNYYPKNEILFYILSISSIWFCLFSVLFIFIFGSLFSLIYSLLRYRKIAYYFETRDNYLFSIKFLKFDNCTKNDDFNVNFAS